MQDTTYYKTVWFTGEDSNLGLLRDNHYTTGEPYSDSGRNSTAYCYYITKISGWLTQHGESPSAPGSLKMFCLSCICFFGFSLKPPRNDVLSQFSLSTKPRKNCLRVPRMTTTQTQCQFVCNCHVISLGRYALGPGCSKTD